MSVLYVFHSIFIKMSIKSAAQTEATGKWCLYVYVCVWHEEMELGSRFGWCSRSRNSTSVTPRNARSDKI